MIPGQVSKCSEKYYTTVLATNQPTLKITTDIVIVTTATATQQLLNLMPPYAGFSGMCILINRTGGNLTTLSSGNILTAITIANNASVVLVYSKLLGKWIIGALA